MYVKKTPNPRLMTPIKVSIIVEEGGATTKPTTIPSIPVEKNNIIKTLTFVGAIYFITGIKKRQYYKLTVKLILQKFSVTGNTLNLQKFHFTSCQCSSAWLEHSPCKRKVVGSDPAIGFHNYILSLPNRSQFL